MVPQKYNVNAIIYQKYCILADFIQTKNVNKIIGIVNTKTKTLKQECIDQKMLHEIINFLVYLINLLYRVVLKSEINSIKNKSYLRITSRITGGVLDVIIISDMASLTIFLNGLLKNVFF